MSSEPHLYPPTVDGEGYSPAPDLDLAALVGSRLCHDLISPLGAIGNGVELLSIAGNDDTGPELALIAESAAAANAKLRFFRIAFGCPSPDQRLGRSEIAGLLADISHEGRISRSWQAEGDHTRAELKLVFLALLCVEAALPRGGEISIFRRPGEWEIAALAPQTRENLVLWSMIDGLPGPVTPAEVQFPLLAREAERLERGISWTLVGTGVRIAIDAPEETD